MHTPEPVCKAGAQALCSGYTHYTPNAGLPVLRQAISDHAFATPGLYQPQEIIVTNGGMGKRSCVSTYRKTNRGARGVVNVRLRENETVLGVVQVTDEDELMMTTERGQLVRIPVHEIRRVGRAAKGVIIMRLNDGDRITGISKVAAAEKTENSSNKTFVLHSLVIDKPERIC